MIRKRTKTKARKNGEVLETSNCILYISLCPVPSVVCPDYHLFA